MNIPVVSEGSLNDRIVRAPGFAFCTVVLAHLSISWSVMGRPEPERPMSVFVIFILSRLSTPSWKQSETKRDVPHELPDETEHERLGPVDDIGALNPHQVHPVLFPELHRVIRVLDLLEPGECALIRGDPNVLCFLAPVQRRSRRPCVALGFRDASPDDRAREDLVKGLEDDQPVFDVLKEVEYAWFDAERVEPEGKDTGFAFAFCVEIFDGAIVFGFLFVERGEAGPGVEEVGDKGEIEAGVSGDEGGGGEVFATADGGGVLEDLFGACTEVFGLERGAGAFVGFELIEEDGVVFTVGDVAAKVVDSKVMVRTGEGRLGVRLPSLPSCSLQVVVEPSEENLIGGQAQEIVDGLALFAETIQFGMKFDVDLGKETSADDLPNETQDEMFSSLGDIR